MYLLLIRMAIFFLPSFTVTLPQISMYLLIYFLLGLHLCVMLTGMLYRCRFKVATQFRQLGWDVWQTAMHNSVWGHCQVSLTLSKYRHLSQLDFQKCNFLELSSNFPQKDQIYSKFKWSPKYCNYEFWVHEWPIKKKSKKLRILDDSWVVSLEGHFDLKHCRNTGL